MTEERIREVVDFFYSSDNQDDVPLRLSICISDFRGFDLDPEDCVDLLTILTESQNLKDDLAQFLLRYKQD